MAEARRLAVLGSPIAHSRSPQLHAAAYRELGLPWEYGRVEVPAGTLAEFLAGLDGSWRGLSLTMPLKREVLPLLDEADDVVAASGVCNTVLLDGGRRRGFNTDVGGLVAALAERGVGERPDALLLGGGATAVSMLLALERIGTQRVTVAVRTPERAAALHAVVPALDVRIVGFGEPLPGASLLASTVPGNADLPELPDFAPGTALVDVAYEPWPSALARRWGSTGPIVGGLDMLLHQAVLQVRIFTGGVAALPLPDETSVARAMRAAVGGF
ncbi:MAG: shikimate dehydrogenase [Naasia sp.]|nr:shikimate dehydrogenase [Naasia sp.]